MWSPLGGKHLQDAREILDGIRYWEIIEKDPEAAKCGEPSTMYSITEGDMIKIYYEMPSQCLEELPVNKDTLKFKGNKNGKRYHGTAYVFTKYCGGKSIGYDMSGSENQDHTLVTLKGPAPIIEPETCQVIGKTPLSENSTLSFKALTSDERSAKTKPSEKNNRIR